MYKEIRVVRFSDIELLESFVANSTPMGPLEYKPRIEFIRSYKVEAKAREIAKEALMLLQTLSSACSNCTRREDVEPEPQWTATLRTTETRILERNVTMWKVVLLSGDSLESQQQQHDNQFGHATIPNFIHTTSPRQR